MIKKLTYYVTSMGLGLGLGLGLLLLFGVTWVSEEGPSPKGKSTPKTPNLITVDRASSFASNPQTRKKDTVDHDIEYLSTLNTKGLKRLRVEEIISKDVVFQEGETYAIRTILKKADGKKLLLMETFSQDLNLVSEEVYKADVVEIDVLPSNYPEPPGYPPPTKDTYKKTVPRSKSNRDLQRLSAILKQDIKIIPTGTSWGTTPPGKTQTNLNEGYRILVTAPSTPQEIFNLYKKLQGIAGNSGMVRLQKP